ncbi:MAG: type II toxin-antitoxin system HicA family toxin [Acidobacteriota bacterium]|nr:type II toxin-antitoxin system HicA family toxin [Acidobacteriota bacterium]
MKLPLLSGKQVLSAFVRLGFVEIHRKGSHVKMKHSDGRLIVFPFHDEVDRYTLKGALRDAEIKVEDFLKQIKK